MDGRLGPAWVGPGGGSWQVSPSPKRTSRSQSSCCSWRSLSPSRKSAALLECSEAKGGEDCGKVESSAKVESPSLACHLCRSSHVWRTRWAKWRARQPNARQRFHNGRCRPGPLLGTQLCHLLANLDALNAMAYLTEEVPIRRITTLSSWGGQGTGPTRLRPTGHSISSSSSISEGSSR